MWFFPLVFTGKEKDTETGYGYFGARYMDHELMTMWLSVDPMADKYPSISPYAYCAWNPIKLVDPDGREFDPASQEIINVFKKTTEELLKSMDCTTEKRKELLAALSEIAELEESKQMYHIRDIGLSYSRENGGILYNAGDNSVEVEYDGMIGSLAHELKHAYQFQNGELSFSKNGDCFGELYDITDEQAALRRGGAYDIQQLETLKNVDYSYHFKTTVAGNPKIDTYYPFLDKRPNSHSIVGQRTNYRSIYNASELQIDLSNDYYIMP